MKTFLQFAFEHNLPEAFSFFGKNASWQKFIDFLAKETGDQNWLKTTPEMLRDMSMDDKKALVFAAYRLFGTDRPNDDVETIEALLGLHTPQSWMATNRLD